MSEKEGIREELMTMASFVLKYLLPSCSDTVTDCSTNVQSIAYLAQHQLLEQIPSLKNDIVFSEVLNMETVQKVNAWIGTKGTRTPLHFDTYDNLFVQLVGAKYIRLYEKKETPKLYVIRGDDSSSYAKQGNMSAVDCENEDFVRHPLAEYADFTEVVLFPGDILYIPAKTWHYVRSLSTSVSVNFWW